MICCFPGDLGYVVEILACILAKISPRILGKYFQAGIGFEKIIFDKYFNERDNINPTFSRFYKVISKLILSLIMMMKNQKKILLI